MNTSILCVKAFGDCSNPEQHPQIDAEGFFVHEQSDGDVLSVSFSNLQLRQGGAVVLETEHGLDGKLFITNSRIIVLCKDYDTRSVLWLGNPLVTVLVGVASSALSRAKTAGTVLTGHIRYEWIAGLAPQSEKVLFGLVDESLVVEYDDPFCGACSLVVALNNKKGLAHKVDAEIKQRFAQYHRQRLSGRSEAPPLLASGNTGGACTSGGARAGDAPAVGGARAGGAPAGNYCAQCGGAIKAQDVYCKHCGAKLW